MRFSKSYRVFCKKIKKSKIFERNNIQIIDIIKQISNFDCECFLISEFSFDSGLLILPSIQFFNSSFNFQDLDFYRVTLVCTNFSNAITFWEVEESESSVQVEIVGTEWFDLLRIL